MCQEYRYKHPQVINIVHYSVFYLITINQYMIYIVQIRREFDEEQFFIIAATHTHLNLLSSRCILDRVNLFVVVDLDCQAVSVEGHGDTEDEIDHSGPEDPVGD